MPELPRSHWLSRYSAAQFGPLCDVFARAEYTEPAVLDRLRIGELLPFRQRVRTLPQFLWRTRAGTPLDKLLRLFFLQRSIACSEAESLFSPILLQDLVAGGLLQFDGNQLQATVELIPYQGLLLAADWPMTPSESGEPVMGVAASSRALTQMTIRRHASRTLDVGTGCGVQALLAAPHSDRVWAVDLNPRSIEFALFNAQLNKLSNIVGLEGNLLEPVGDQSFDLIVCNPPFVIGPGRSWLHTQSGQPCDQFCQELIRQTSARLNERGYCQLIGNWAHLAGQDSSQRLQTWFDGTGCDALVFRSHTEDAATNAHNRVSEIAESPVEAARLFDEWMAYYEQERIESISFGVITLRRSAERPNWFECESLPEVLGPCGAAIEQRFERRDFSRAHRDDNDLLTCWVRPAEHLRWELQRTLSGGEWIAVESRLRILDGLVASGNATPEVIDFVASCTAQRPLGEHLRQIAAASGQDASQLAPEFLKVVRRLMHLGYLLPIEIDKQPMLPNA